MSVWRRNCGAIALLVLSVAVLGGCAVNRVFIPEVHKVHPGESLSSIAAGYGLNWHNLARWNDIEPPYTIYIGQRLSLDPFPPLNYDRMRRRRRAARVSRHPTPRSTVTAMPDGRGPRVTRVPAPRTPTRPTPEAPANTVSPRDPGSSGHSRESADGADETAVATRQPQRPAADSGLLVGPQGWRWPLASSVLDSNGADPIRHGINLYGTAGTPVYAARAGQVVYSGVGLQGYGRLVIIKHEGNYLSAYGYAQNVRVEEGDRIAAGEHIADMGLGPGSRAMLYFEVRHGGEPVPPKRVLPQR